MTVVRHAVAATAALGVAAATAALVTTGTASAAPIDQQCTVSQLTSTLVAGDPGAGQRYAEVRFTAKSGQSCTLTGNLPLQLTGAPGVTVEQDSAKAPAVQLTAGSSATILLHWSAIEDSTNQVTPTSLTVTADAPIVLPWKQGPIDSSAGAHTLMVGAVTAAA